jgi:hypothetical protein
LSAIFENDAKRSGSHFNEKESVFNAGARIKLTNLNTFLLAAGRSLPGSTNHEPRFFMYVGRVSTFGSISMMTAKSGIAFLLIDQQLHGAIQGPGHSFREYRRKRTLYGNC